eukprot:m.197824 g.197824  ORF g.197824 m.197824 type:complete len:224 (-) comp53776_c0_seq2:95-766(-)
MRSTSSAASLHKHRHSNQGRLILGFSLFASSGGSFLRSLRFRIYCLLAFVPSNACPERCSKDVALASQSSQDSLGPAPNLQLLNDDMLVNSRLLENADQDFDEDDDAHLDGSVLNQSTGHFSNASNHSGREDDNDSWDSWDEQVESNETLLKCFAEFLHDISGVLGTKAIAERVRRVAESNRVALRTFDLLLRSLPNKHLSSLKWIMQQYDPKKGHYERSSTL